MMGVRHWPCHHCRDPAVLRTAAVGIYRRFIDAVDPELTAFAEAAITMTFGVREIEQVRLRWIGHRLRAEAGVVVGDDLDVVSHTTSPQMPNTACSTQYLSSLARRCTLARKPMANTDHHA